MLSFVELLDASDAPSVVQDVVDRLLVDEGLTPDQVVVLADDRSVVDALLQRVAGGSVFVGLGGHGVVAETIHRYKGLEANIVVLVLTANRPLDDSALLYVGMSRAKAMLIVIAPKAVRNRFDLR